jgi:hypothetical protein
MTGKEVMMSRVKIILQINPQGQVILQTQGVKGPACRQIARFLRESLGQVLHEQRTAEFYQTPCRSLSEIADQNLPENQG